MCMCKPTEYYRLLAINDTISLGGSVNLTFIAITNGPRTYHKALCSSYSNVLLRLNIPNYLKQVFLSE